MKIQSKILLILGVFSLGFSFGQRAQATADSTQETGGFNYETVHPENQRNKGVNYFDLKMSPGQNQTVHIDFTNTGSTEMALDIEIAGAKTNQNGVIEYGLTSLENDPSLVYPFEEVVTGPAEIIIPPESTVPLELAIAMPTEEFDGMIAGGIRFQPKENPEDKKEGITQQFSYVVGMVLSETETPVTAHLELNDVFAELNNYRGAIYVDFSNTTATFINKVTVNATIAAAEDPNTILYEARNTGMRMAPNTFMTYPVSMSGATYRSGDYVATVDVYATEGEWHWQQEFTITEELANELNEQNIYVVQEQGFDWWLIAFIVAGIFGLIAVIALIIHLNNKKKKRNRRAIIKQKKKNKMVEIS